MALALWPRDNFPTARPRAALSVALAASLVIGGSLTALFAPAASAQAEAFSTAASAPGDALAYVQIPLDESSAQWTQAKTLLDRAGLLTSLEEATGNELNELPLDAFLGGEAAIVITQDAIQHALEANPMAAGDSMAALLEETPETDATTTVGEAQGWAVVLDARAPDTSFAGITMAIQDQARKAGVEPGQTEYSGVTITSAPAAPSGDEDNSDDIPLAVARIDGHVLIASQPADLEPLIDAAQGTTPALTSLDSFGQVQAALPGEHLLFGFINGPAAALAQSSLAEAGLPMYAAGPEAYSGFSISADQPGFRMETVEIGANGETLPAGQPNFSPTLPAKTPADALFFLDGSNLAATKVLDNIGAALIGMAMGQMGAAPTPAPGQSPDAFVAAQYQQLATLFGVNLQTDLLQQLTGEFALWVGGTDPSTVAGLFVSGVTDPATVANALSQLNLLIQGAGGGDSSVTTRTVDGSTVSVVETGPGAPAIEYGVVGDELLLGVGAAIDEHTLGPAQSLADDAQYQAAMGTLPAEYNGSLYVNLAKIVPLATAMATAETAESSGAVQASLEDASPNCANYATQEEAQAAYDANEEGTFDLDQDFNGIVCEGHFGSPAALEDATGMNDAAAALESVDLSAIKAFALAAYEQDGMQRTSSILYIAE
ncbi:MAG: DUF3352 domain-containing protein [Thermomicrobiales bacterium]|nr:DUF3352 domain-containing protein [Thermomicrobiales bacterium]